MKTPHRRAVETRRLYRFESLSIAYSPYANKPRTLSFLRRLARVVWARHGRRGLPCPVVEFGNGTPFGGGRAAYCEGYSYINLCEGQRSVTVLLHELTHARGHGTHGAGFVGKYFDLLADYGKCDQALLAIDAARFGIKA